MAVAHQPLQPSQDLIMNNTETKPKLPITAHSFRTINMKHHQQLQFARTQSTSVNGKSEGRRQLRLLVRSHPRLKAQNLQRQLPSR